MCRQRSRKIDLLITVVGGWRLGVWWCWFRAVLSWNICGSKQKPTLNKEFPSYHLHHHQIRQGPAMAMPSREDTPHFIFINPKPSVYEDPSTSLCNAWNRAIVQYFPSDPSPPFTVHEGELNKLDADLLRCDCIVSPANSYGIMDGGCATYSQLVEVRILGLIMH